jgi:hypothetical protein
VYLSATPTVDSVAVKIKQDWGFGYGCILYFLRDLYPKLTGFRELLQKY